MHRITIATGGVMPPSGGGNAGNLPVELTSFVGRRGELSQVKRLLATHRLVTLTGVGGTGKTRLAVRAVDEITLRFPHGVWFVDLTELPRYRPSGSRAVGRDLLAALVAVTLRLPEQPVPLRLLATHLSARQMLLVLDNCEHVLPACAELAGTLLGACPGVRILTTTREPLGLAGEAAFPVPPLPTPEPGDHITGADLAELARCEAVVLFVARARAAEPTFALTAANGVQVAEICRRLDGLPLAIELAAARIRVLEPQQILDRLADRFALLTRGNRGRPPRQRTLRACIDWSYGLCTDQERLLWARLSVFVGGFELDAVEGVCADERLPEADLLDLVAELVDKSILVRYHHGGQARYRMLDTIRDFGHRQLAGAGELDALRRHHRDWYERLVTRLREEWIGPRQAYWSTRMDRERPNLRAALEFCLEDPGEAEAALRLSVALPFSFWGSALFTEGRRRLDIALARTAAPSVLRAQALVLDAQLAIAQGDGAAGERLLREGEQLARRLGDAAGLSRALFIRGLGLAIGGDMPAAARLLERALATLSAAPLPDLETQLDILHSLGVIATWLDDPERALRCHEAVLEITESRGEGQYRSRSIWGEGLVAWRLGDLARAEQQVADGLRIQREHQLDDRYVTAWCLETLAWITASQERHRRAAVLLGAARAIWTDLGTPIRSNGQMFAHHEASAQRARDGLGTAAFQEAVEFGRSLSHDEAIAYALGERGAPPLATADRPPPPLDAAALPGPAPRSGGPVPSRAAAGRVPAARGRRLEDLTAREQQIADLVTLGLSNKQIAADLDISRRTAEAHIESIRLKLGFTNRAQIAAWVAAQRAEGKA